MTHLGFPRSWISDSFGAGRFAPCHQRSDCEMIIRRRRFGRWPDARRTSTRAGGFCRWLGFGTGWTGDRRRRSAAWTGRRCATVSIASTPRVRMGSSTTGPRAPSPACRKSSWPSSPGSSRPDGSREGRRRALAADRPQAGYRGEVRGRLSSALCRQTSAQARLLAHERKAASSGAGRTDRRGV